MPVLAKLVNTDLSKGFTVSQVAEKHGYSEPLVWSIALEGKTDQERFKALNWGLRTWDHWYFNDVDRRFGDDWPGQIPAQLVAHTLFYFTKEGDLVFDPMAGGGVVPDTCLAFGRKCWSFDLADRPETRPEIIPHQWDPDDLVWPVNGNKKPDLIFFDPPYFSKMAQQYAKESISCFSRKEYLEFFRELFPLFKERSKTNARIAFLNADWPPAPLPARRVGPTPRREGLSGYGGHGGKSEPNYFSSRLRRSPEAMRMGNHPPHRLSHVHTTIQTEPGKANAKKPNPWSRSALPDYWKKKLIDQMKKKRI